MSLLRRIILIVSVAVMAAFAGYALVIDFRQRVLVGRDVESKLNTAGDLAAASVANWLSGRAGLVQQAADSIGLNLDLAADQISTKTMVKLFRLNYFGAANGNTLSSTPVKLPPGYDPRTRPWYRDAEQAKHLILTKPYNDTGTGKPIVTVAAPVLVGGDLAGVVASDFFVSSLQEWLAGIEFGGMGFAFLVSEDGTIIVHPGAGLVGKTLSDLFPGNVPPIARTITRAHTAESEMLISFRPLEGLEGAKWHLAVAIDPAKAYASLDEFRLTALVATLAGALLTIGLQAHLLRKIVTYPLKRMTAAMNSLAAGHLDTPVPDRERRDEIGAMAEAVEVFKRNASERERLKARELAAAEAQGRRAAAVDALVAAFQTDVAGSLDLMTGACTGLEGTARSLSSNAEAGARNARGAAAAAEEASQNVRSVAAASEELAASIGEISQRAAASREVAARAARTARETDATVQGLASVGARISEIVALIEAIAGQTNLLALNATIEAARAGEAGKGFAVVAAEVKELASQTGRATGDIAGQIRAIQEASQEAVSAIGTIGTVVGEMNTIAADISAAMQQQGAATREIAGSVQQAATGTTEVSGHVADVGRGAAATGADAGQVLAAAGRLSQEAGALRHRVEHFLAEIRVA